MNLLGGLGFDYNAVVTAINIRGDKISVEAIHNILLAFENRLEQQSSVDQISAMAANYASSSNNRGGGRRYNGSRGHSYTSFTPNASNYNYRGRGHGGRYTQSGRHNSISSEKATMLVMWQIWAYNTCLLSHILHFLSKLFQ